MKWTLRIAGVGLLALVGWLAWQHFFVTDEMRVKKLVGAAAHAIESGNLIKLEDAFAHDYTDEFGFDKSTVIGGVQNFRSDYENIFIHLSDLTVTVAPDHKTAQAVFIAKILAKAKGGPQTEIRGDRFRLDLRHTDQGWKIVHAESPALKFE